MRRDNLSLLAELEQQRRACLRLEESFRLEKDEVLTDGSPRALQGFRERSRTHYQPLVAGLRSEVVRITAMLVPGEEWQDEGDAASREILRKIDELTARFIGTPHRLLRNSSVVVELAPGRLAQAPPAPGDDADADGLRLTDPPIPCPACGSHLMTDAGFTMLVCPGCGARETMETEDDGGPPESEEGAGDG